MLLELVQGSELWVILPDGTNLRVDCSDGSPVVVEHWHEGALHQVMSLCASDPKPLDRDESHLLPDKSQTGS